MQSDSATSALLESPATRWLAEHGPRELELLFRAIVYYPATPILITDDNRKYREASAGAGKLRWSSVVSEVRRAGISGASRLSVLRLLLFDLPSAARQPGRMLPSVKQRGYSNPACGYLLGEKPLFPCSLSRLGKSQTPLVIFS